MCSDEVRPVQVAVIGGGNAGAEACAVAAEVGRRLAQAGAVVVCGGLGGVMDAAARGARSAGGDVIGILPGDDPAAANDHVSHVVATGAGEARNLAVVASARSVIAVGGEWGTLAEIAFARRLDRPVVALQTWRVSGAGEMADAPGIEMAETAEDAVERALRPSR
jgi:uncharacterized protein (TIGR00725 family)